MSASLRVRGQAYRAISLRVWAPDPHDTRGEVHPDKVTDDERGPFAKDLNCWVRQGLATLAEDAFKLVTGPSEPIIDLHGNVTTDL